MNPLYPIEWVVALVISGAHSLLSTVLDPNAGWTWALAIISLTLVIRTAILPLYIRTLKSTQKMQEITPEVQRIQAKYKGKTDQVSKQKMSEETMAAYKQGGASPFSSCLPMLIQMPIFLGLFNVLRVRISDAAQAGEGFGPMSAQKTASFDTATWLGITFNDTFIAGDLNVKVVAGFMIAFLVASMFLQQKLLTMPNMNPTAMQGPMASTQKMMLYGMPFIYVITGPGIPVGVLLYWTITNLYGFGQQFWMVWTMPGKGSVWMERKQERTNASRIKQGLEPIDFEAEEKRKAAERRAADKAQEAEDNIRVQPTGKKRAKAQGKKLNDEEKLAEARRLREEAAEERRRAREAAGEASETEESGAGPEAAKKPNQPTAKAKAKKKRRPR